MKLSIIIPTLNEEDNIEKLLGFLNGLQQTYVEIIVVDGGSKDSTVERAKAYKNVLCFDTQLMSRAKQMNYGAEKASGEMLYFIHADVMPLPSFYADILQAQKEGYDFGCYRFKFDKEHRALAFNAYFTRFNRMFCRGGDQTMFITKTLFNKYEGFDTYYSIMEDFDFIRRVKKKEKFKIIPKSVVVSARKYDHNSYLKVNLINLMSYWMFMLGKSPDDIRTFYKKNLVMKYE
ncbi:transferase 2, rSAM/selenodomain-associated [Lishizhenia tianjinensis]|uniref:Transferase 2, rSAM/selenodomain-associated n=1 Tax=Lishizhenia tianjinensis TaxID=477690 RepID=A0A1I7BFN6_9FLAO|nr:TIGR04283 family arsenosugar biosynthesis glycosyltransferase [Lishizhenia tianjinensis]SFT85932.1 transferase 2, rSAM/selenodomain-associated [Lishizhenia tianjinensis]